MEEGYDLIGGLCRYYVLWKVPFPDYRSRRNQARKSDPSFHNNAAKETILQCVGRPMREEGDWCDGLILDAHFKWFKNSVTWPEEFRRTWREVNEIPLLKEDDYRARVKPPMQAA
jgi:Rad3-related DNA helicase